MIYRIELRQDGAASQARWLVTVFFYLRVPSTLCSLLENLRARDRGGNIGDDAIGYGREYSDELANVRPALTHQ